MKHYIKLALSAIITCSIGYAENLKMCQSELKECKSKSDKMQGCVETENDWFVKIKTPYKNGKEEGIAKWCRGNLVYGEAEFKNGKRDGMVKWFAYDYKGEQKIIKEIPYKDGKREGIAKYYSNGKLAREVPYKDDKKEGIEKQYHYPSGNLEQEISYKNDMKEGIAKRYYENGNLRSEDLYKDDKREGIAKHYSENGNLIAMITYQKDEAISYECANGRKILDINKLGIPIGYSGFMGHIDAWKVEINMYKTCG
ncbi:MAG: toxin-antitoxin system YwqK family antitoxin [Helicobacter sp.]|uniref:toxin-antitoxin system YwqK family antitoxin n=1 Tax=Helicobacter sp. TaxID=218 RepID=UPI002A918A1A|nr:toxin-antitoxin system YwqK family antitoxin [Helicobacter sp.]MDY5949895.1 toxin-antitoxin system YwqK family antitoxin [Helicobacter sp.]